MPSINIRRARPKDWPCVVGIENATRKEFDEDFGVWSRCLDRWDKQDFVETWKGRNSDVFVVEQGGEVIGFTAFYIETPDIYIDRLAFNPQKDKQIVAPFVVAWYCAQLSESPHQNRLLTFVPLDDTKELLFWKSQDFHSRLVEDNLVRFSRVRHCCKHLY